MIRKYVYRLYRIVLYLIHLITLTSINILDYKGIKCVHKWLNGFEWDINL